MKTIKNKTITLLLALAAVTFSLTSCEKDAHTPPDLVFITTAGYTSADATVGVSDTLLVGITATKTEDELKTYNVSYAYDGATTTTTAYNYTLTTSEEDSYSKDYQVITRSTAGTEKWVFTITDRDGNIASKTINLTVN